MDNLEKEIWRMVPPEEKFEVMARAQSKGVLAAGVTIVIACTLAVGFRMSWLMWGSFIVSPFIFQFAAGKAWRSLRPKVLLEYLAARSASRRYAFNTRAKDLTATMIFKGHLEELYENHQIQEALEATISNTKEAEVWVSLFGDALTMIKEEYGGASLSLAAMLDDRLEVTSRSISGRDYGNDKELIIKVRSRDADEPAKRYRLTSRYPAALVVFEKKLQQLKSIALEQPNPVNDFIEEAAAAAQSEDDKFNNMFNF